MRGQARRGRRHNTTGCCSGCCVHRLDIVYVRDPVLSVVLTLPGHEKAGQYLGFVERVCVSRVKPLAVTPLHAEDV